MTAVVHHEAQIPHTPEQQQPAAKPHQPSQTPTVDMQQIGDHVYQQQLRELEQRRQEADQKRAYKLQQEATDQEELRIKNDAMIEAKRKSDDLHRQQLEIKIEQQRQEEEEARQKQLEEFNEKKRKAAEAARVREQRAEERSR